MELGGKFCSRKCDSVVRVRKAPALLTLTRTAVWQTPLGLAVVSSARGSKLRSICLRGLHSTFLLDFN